MPEIIIKILVNAVAILAGAYLLKGVEVKGFLNAVIAALLLALANSFVKPILVFLSFPVTVLTLGLFLLVINGAIIWLVSSLLSGFRVKDFGTAIIFSIVLWAINMVLSWIIF